MTATAAPSIPPRPTRPQKQQGSGPVDVPKVPPRPSNRRVERSVSPNRDSFARSPLNETTFAINHGNNSGNFYTQGRNISASNLPQRPPSVSLPSIGQEGEEYGNVYDNESGAEAGSSEIQETQTRNIANDLKLHAPKPTLPASTAKAKTATVTRTDSTQAAAAGIGRPDDKDPHLRSLKAKGSFPSNESQSTERPASTQPSDSEHGIPEIGLRVPMYPNAGDVQAPSPSPHQSTPFSSGIGFHNDGTQRAGRHHKRTPSGREFSGPPGSYGLHGHGGVANVNKFEKAWYDKHPEALEREENGEYGPGLGAVRAEWALSSDDLNRVVRETASRGAGYGTSPGVEGTPDEQIGYLASEEYAARIVSPGHHASGSNASQTHITSPLREEITSEILTARRSSSVLEDHSSEEDVIHVDPLLHGSSRIHGGGYDLPTEDLGPDAGNTSDHGGWIDERGYGVPILASDEVSTDPAAEHLQPAVSPHQERKSSSYIGSDYERIGSRASSRPGSVPTSTPASRPGSRPASISGSLPGFSRYAFHDEHEDLGTPLEDVEEYEPLFPEDEKEAKSKGPMDNLKRPDLNVTKSSSASIRSTRRKFPSKDIWEDAPSSAQLEATVSTPQLPEEQETTKGLGEDTEESSNRATQRQNEADGDEASTSFLPKETVAWIKPGAHLEEMNKSRSKQRFPSKDIWEDTPESLQLETTVSNPQADDIMSPERPTTDASAIAQDRAADGNELEEGEARPTTGAALERPAPPPRPVKKQVTEEKEASPSAGPSQPSIPARPAHRVRNLPPAEIPPRPAKSGTSSVQARAVPPPPSKVDEGSTESGSSPLDKKAPVLPDRPKPQIPVRPAKPVQRKSGDSADTVPLAKTVSGGSASEEGGSSRGPPPPTTKPKPVLPSRPVGGKIAALKAGFMSDLDKRLQLGPQAPAVKSEAAEEPVAEDKEKQPLSDARKGRARGPARRKPAASPSGIAEEGSESKVAQKLEFSTTVTVWQISEDGDVVVHSEPEKPDPSTQKKAELDPTPILATNMAGEPLIASQDIAPGASKPGHIYDDTQDAAKVAEEDEERRDLVSRVTNESESSSTVPKASDDPPITDEGPAATSSKSETDEDPEFVMVKKANTSDTESPSAEAAEAADVTAGTSNPSPVEAKTTPTPITSKVAHFAQVAKEKLTGESAGAKEAEE